MNKKIKKSMLVVVLVMAVGFAAVATNLAINGNILIGTNESDFDVVFTEAKLDTVDVTTTAIIDDGKTITFETADLAALNDSSLLEFKVANNSTQYDADVTMTCTGGDNEGVYYTITKTLPTSIASKSSANGTVTVTLDKVTTDAITETLTCTIVANAVEKEASAN